MSDRPVIDLSSGQYDELENKLSQFLGIKVMLVRNPDPEHRHLSAYANVVFASNEGDQGKFDQAKEELKNVERSVNLSLEDYLLKRDATIGVPLKGTELQSLREVGHVTLRDGNCDPAQAVLIMDPDNKPSEWSDEFNLMRWIFHTGTVRNAWRKGEDDRCIDVKALADNLDISNSDRRAYLALMHVHHALRNQNEYDNKDRGYYTNPYYYEFCGLTDQKDMYDELYCEMSLMEARQRLRPEGWMQYHSESLGLSGNDFTQKLAEARALTGGLTLRSLAPIETFARLQMSHAIGNIGESEVAAIQQRLNENLKTRFKQKFAQSGNESIRFVMSGLDDWRILFPLFREIHEQDQSTGPERIYLDTIMAGLQRYFPTITNAPVPDFAGVEPPRTLEGYKKAQTLKTGLPQPPTL